MNIIISKHWVFCFSFIHLVCSCMLHLVPLKKEYIKKNIFKMIKSVEYATSCHLTRLAIQASHVLLFMPRINERGLLTYEGRIIDRETASKINYLSALI